MLPPLSHLDEDEQLFRDSVLAFARDRIAPHVRQMDEESEFRSDLLEEMFQLGLMAIEIPEQYGGQDGDFFQAVLAIEALAEVDPSAAVIVDVQNTLVNNALLRYATGEQKQRFLPHLATDTLASYALSEPESGSDAFALKTRAVDRGDRYALSGRKLWITNAKEAGLYLLFATIDPAAGYKGVTAFLVEHALSSLLQELDLDELPLVSLLDTLERKLKSGTLKVLGKEIEGDIAFHAGKPYKAETKDGRRGAAAIERLLEVQDGQAIIDPNEREIGEREIAEGFSTIIARVRSAVGVVPPASSIRAPTVSPGLIG